MIATLYLVGIWLHENEFTVIFYDGQKYVIGKPLSERRSVAVFQTDLQIISTARQLISEGNSWSRTNSQQCKDTYQRSLFCALYQAQLKLNGSYEHRLPANQHVRFAIDDLYSSRWSKHRLADFNAHPDTNHEDVLKVLDVAADAIQNKLNKYRSEFSALLDNFVPNEMQKYHIPNVSVSVVQKGELLLTKSMSLDGVNDQEPIFEVASLGKPVLAYIALQLEKEGIINLDTPLIEYKRDIFSSDNPNLNLITARMVLSHTSGLKNFDNEDPEGLLSPPRKEFHYSGSGYTYLQSILEHLTGKDLEALAQEFVFKPLGMHSSSYIWQAEFEERFLHGHDSLGEKQNQKRKPNSAHAAWSLYSTASDYAKFIVYFLGANSENNDVSDRMLETQIKITDEISWGLGWGLQVTKPNSSFWHWGSNPGFRSYVVGYPQEGLGIVVLSNSDNLFKLIEPLITQTIGGTLPSFHWF